MPDPRTPDPATRRLAALFGALASESRLALLRLLAEHGELPVTELAGRTGLTQPAASLHLARLKAAGLVEDRRDGRFNRYALRPGGLRELIDHLAPGGDLARLNPDATGVELRKR